MIGSFAQSMQDKKQQAKIYYNISAARQLLKKIKETPSDAFSSN